jgi:hypothetical protein
MDYNSQIKCFRTRVEMDILSCFGKLNSCPEFVYTFQLHSVYWILGSNSSYYEDVTPCYDGS